MNYADYIRIVPTHARGAGAALALAGLFLLGPAAAHGRQAMAPASQAPPAPVAPAVAPVAPPAQSQPPARSEEPSAPRSPAPAAPAARPPLPRKAPVAPGVVPPREVVTVVHRLSGWKLLTWLATSGPPTLELDEWPSPSDAHTNIVAGYVYSDGRSVVARLPQSEVELDSYAAPPVTSSFFARAVGQTANAQPEYVLVTPSGEHVEAKFVGLDSSTGLALLEAGKPLLPGGMPPTGEWGDTDDPTVGQLVRLYAPSPAEAPAAPAVPPAPPAPPPPPGVGYIYLGIDQKEGRLSNLVRAPSGRLSSVVVGAEVAPEWVGAVAANEQGEVVGIVSQSRDGETRLLPVASVREACERVLKLRGTAPQPWLGVRGDAAAQAPLNKWTDFGWPQEFARAFIESSQGILLDSVAPGTPAALAGLRAGDLITSVGPRAVRNGADFSMTLQEAGVGSVVDFTVWRAPAPEPLKLTVELKGVKNPARATAQAEETGFRASLLDLEREIREMRATAMRLRSQPAGTQARAAELAHISENIAAAEGRAARLRERLRQAQELLSVNGLFSVEGAPVIVRPQPGTNGLLGTSRLKSFGLHAIGLSSRSAAPLGAQSGLLVVVVQPESPAAASGLRPGDVIETVNGAPVRLFELRQLNATPGAGTAVFGLVRGGQRLTVSLTATPAPESQR